MTHIHQTIRFRSASDILRLAWANPEFWIEPDAYLRYAPVINWIRRSENINPAILEVGSGNYGLNAYVSLPIVKTDLKISKQKIGSSIKASAEALPFQDSVFDLVCAIDLLEHVSLKLRWPMILELIRVAKRNVILVFPFGKKARDSDLKIAAQFRNQHNRSLSVLEAHQEYPFPETNETDLWIRRLIQQGFSVHSEKSFGIQAREMLLLNWLQKRKCARFWAERIIENQILRKLINFGNCYRLVLRIHRPLDHNSHPEQSHNIPKPGALL